MDLVGFWISEALLGICLDTIPCPLDSGQGQNMSFLAILKVN